MDSIAGTGLEGERVAEAHPPAALLVIVLDTNPYAWHELSPHITLGQAVADLLVFVNAHLAFNHANRVAVLASHCGTARWLFPSAPAAAARHRHQDKAGARDGDGGDAAHAAAGPPADPNKYRPFAVVEHEVMHNLRALLDGTTEEALLASPTSTTLAGALTMALSYISKLSLIGGVGASTGPLGAGDPMSGPASGRGTSNARVLIVSTSGDLAAQYIPLMNVIFASQHLRIPLDILKLAGDTVLLQQASYTTSGVFLSPSQLVDRVSGGDAASEAMSNGDATSAASPHGRVSLLPTLLFAFLADPITRTHLVPSTAINVDFRAACFCHKRVVDVGYVCSICLSIFCEEGVATYMQQGPEPTNGPAEGAKPALIPNGVATCLICNTQLHMRMFGNEPLLLDDKPATRKKKKKQKDGDNDEA